MPIYFRNAPVREPFIYDSIGKPLAAGCDLASKRLPFLSLFTDRIRLRADYHSGKILSAS